MQPSSQDLESQNEEVRVYVKSWDATDSAEHVGYIRSAVNWVRYLVGMSEVERSEVNVNVK